jgi:hypothetical protein
MIMHQNLLLGICQPNTAHANTIVAINKNVERETSTDKIERALNALIENQRRSQPNGQGGPAAAVPAGTSE